MFCHSPISLLCKSPKQQMICQEILVMKDPQLTSFYLHNNNQVIHYLQITQNLGYIACKTIVLIYPAQLFIYFLIPKSQFQKNWKTKHWAQVCPSTLGPIFYNKNNLFVIESLAKFNKTVIEFPLKKTTIFKFLCWKMVKFCPQKKMFHGPKVMHIWVRELWSWEPLTVSRKRVEVIVELNNSE
jgi:adenine-specific DNA methylase